jgi:predicted RNA binding protein YcfA (HicA-like mRNA interferase family)
MQDSRMSQPALPRVLNQRSARRLLEEHGWIKERGGKHVVKMTKPGRRPITLPHHGGGDYSRDLTAAILRQAGLKGEGGQ